MSGRPPPIALSPEIATFLEVGLIMFVATRGPDLAPECTMVAAARVEAGGTRLTLFMPEGSAAVTLANLRDNGQAALTVTRVTDDRSLQIKGTLVSQRLADDGELGFLQQVLERRAGELARVGMPRSVSARLICWPAVAITLQVREIFVQTPGPEAGRPMTSPRDLT